MGAADVVSTQPVGVINKPPVAKYPVAVSQPSVAVATSSLAGSNLAVIEKLESEARAPQVVIMAEEQAGSKLDADYDPPEEHQTVTDFGFPTNWHQPRETKPRETSEQEAALQDSHKAMQQMVAANVIKTLPTGVIMDFQGVQMKASEVVEEEDGQRVLPPMAVLPLTQSTVASPVETALKQAEVKAAVKAAVKAETTAAKKTDDQDWVNAAQEVLDKQDKSAKKHEPLVKLPASPEAGPSLQAHDFAGSSTHQMLLAQAHKADLKAEEEYESDWSY